MSEEEFFEFVVTHFDITPEQYYNYTPRELSLIIDQQNNQQKEKNKEILYLAWHIEALARCKKLPKYSELINESTKASNQTEKSQTLMQKVKILNQLFGGKEE